MRALELGLFLALSGSLHVAALGFAPQVSGGSSGGQGGENQVTLQAATPTLAAMVDTWTRSPDISTAPQMQTPVAQPATDVPDETSVAPQMPAVQPLNQTRAPDALPKLETRLPAPLTPFAGDTPAALTAPQVPTPSAVAMPAPPTTQQATPAPSRLSAPDVAALPKLDTAPAESRTAPRVSHRPVMRPDRPKRAAPKHKTTQTASRPNQTARGAGTSAVATQAPARRAPAASGPSQAQLQQLERQWGVRVTAALRRAHRAPSGTRATGTVRLVIALTPSGRVEGASIAASSGNARLDKAAMDAVRRARFPQAPKGLTKSTYRFSQRLTVSR